MKLYGMKHLLCSFLFFNIFLVAEAQRNNLIYENTFEVASSVFKGWEREVSTKYGLNYSDSVARNGSGSARFELRMQDPLIHNGKRSEVRLFSETNPERWYGLSMFLPAKDYKDDIQAEALVQWHEQPDFHLGESWRIPPISLVVINGYYELRVYWAINSVNNDENYTGSKVFNLGAVYKDCWNDFVFHIKFSYKDNGVLEIWRDGKQILNYVGPNSYNDTNYPYFKLGIYKWQWKDTHIKSVTNKRVVFFDEIRIGNKEATYKDVTPEKAIE